MTATTLEYNSTTISTAAARLAIAGIAVYQILLVVLIFVRPDLDPSWHTISEWAIGPYGWIMSGAFLISVASYAGLFLMLKSQLRGALGRIGLGILLVCVIGATGVGLFTTDPMPLHFPLSTRGTLHLISGTGQLVLLPFAAASIRRPADQPEPRVQESDMDKCAQRTALDLRSSTSRVSEFCALFGDLSCSLGTGRLRTGRKYRLASTLRVFYLHGLGRGLGLASNSVQQANFWSMKARR